MNVFWDWVQGFSTVGALAYFFTGFLCSYLLAFFWCKRQHSEFRVNFRYAGIAVGIAVLVFMSLQTQRAYTLAAETAQEVQECQREFNMSLRARAQITTENDSVSIDQRMIVYNWIHNLIFPPAPYNTMETNSPERQAYGLRITQETDKLFQDSIERQNDLQSKRDNHPLPDPLCGK